VICVRHCRGSVHGGRIQRVRRAMHALLPGDAQPAAAFAPLGLVAAPGIGLRTTVAGPMMLGHLRVVQMHSASLAVRVIICANESDGEARRFFTIEYVNAP